MVLIVVWEKMSNVIPYFVGQSDYLSMLGLKLIHVIKGAPGLVL